MADTVKHRSVAKTGYWRDRWNEEHRFSGGKDGQVLTRDPSASDGASWTTLPTIAGERGHPGEAGAPGPAGVAGADGITPIKGVDYFDGTAGTPGPPGPPGADSTVPGPVGPAGPASTVPGPSGPPGPPGVTPVKGVDYFDGATGAAGPTGPSGADSMIPGPQGLAGQSVRTFEQSGEPTQAVAGDVWIVP